ncbi:MAG TPA: DUF6776 family protein [Eoetvoesiella sp.]
MSRKKRVRSGVAVKNSAVAPVEPALVHASASGPDQVASTSTSVPGAVPARAAPTWPKVLLALVVGLALGYAGARFWFKDQASKRYGQLETEFSVTVAQSQYDLAEARSQVDFVRGQLAVEESTRRTLEATLQATQNELGRARDQLAFFDQLLPPGPNGAVSVRALDIEQTGSTLRYRVLLMRNAPGGETFNGLMQFVANGLQHGKPVKIQLEPAQAVVNVADVSDAGADVNELALSFDQFQRSGGVLSLPEGFVPKTVTLNILEGKAVRVSRTVNLSPVE